MQILQVGPDNLEHPLNKKVRLQVYLRDLQEEAGLTEEALQHIALVCEQRCDAGYSHCSERTLERLTKCCYLSMSCCLPALWLVQDHRPGLRAKVRCLPCWDDPVTSCAAASPARGWSKTMSVSAGPRMQLASQSMLSCLDSCSGKCANLLSLVLSC